MSFTVYPAIDVLDGRVVRLDQGSREHVTVEGSDPVAASRFAAAGASELHLIDLNGAFSGVPDPELVGRLAGAGLPVQVGGGFRSVELIAGVLEAGAARVLVGTAALDDAFLRAAVGKEFGSRLAVAVDARDGGVAIDGWTSWASTTPRALADRCAWNGVARLVVTATRRDGTLTGGSRSPPRTFSNWATCDRRRRSLVRRGRARDS